MYFDDLPIVCLIERQHKKCWSRLGPPRCEMFAFNASLDGGFSARGGGLSGIGGNGMNKRGWVGGNSNFVGTQHVASLLKIPAPCGFLSIKGNRIPGNLLGMGANL